MAAHRRQSRGQSGGGRTVLLVGLGAAVSFGAWPALAADAVFDAEYWIDASTVGVERVDDPAACADAFSFLRRAIRSVSPTNRVVYQLRVGQVDDEGTYEMWVRLKIPADSTRTLLVGQDIGGAFQEPQDSFVVTRGSTTGYEWLRLTRQGSGTAGAPEQDPWPVMLSTTGSDVEIRLVETDILVDRFAISNVTGYLPPDCPVDTSDGGPAAGDGDEAYRSARTADCAAGEFYDRVEERCRAPAEPGCRASAPSALASVVVVLATYGGRRHKRKDV